MTLCPIALATGVPCPGCGMTRALAKLADGDLESALEYHPLVFLIAVELTFAGVWFFLRRRDKVQAMPRWTANLMVISTAAAMVVTWGIRYSAGTLPPI